MQIKPQYTNIGDILASKKSIVTTKKLPKNFNKTRGLFEIIIKKLLDQYSQKDMHSHNRPEATAIGMVIQQLESLWTQGNMLEEEEMFFQSNGLLIQFLDISRTHRVRKPDWKTVFSKHLSAVSTFKNKNIPLYYFKIASQLSHQITNTHLSHLLTKHSYKNLNFRPEELKINYFKYVNDLRNFSFIQKLSVKICQFVAFLQNESPLVEDFFQHYLLGFISDSITKKKIMKIVLAGLDSYFIFCIKNQQQLTQLKHNVFSLMSNLIDLYKEANFDLSILSNCFHNFIVLIRIPPIQDFVSLFSEVSKVPEIMEKLLFSLNQLQKNGSVGSQKLLEKLCLNLIQTKKAASYLKLVPFDVLLSRDSSKVDCIMSILSLHQEIVRINSEGTSNSCTHLADAFQHNCQFVFQHFNQQDARKMIHNISCDLARLINTLDRKYFNFTHILNLKGSQVMNITSLQPLFRLYIKIIRQLEQKSQFKKSLGYCLQQYFTILLCKFIQQPNKNSSIQILQFFNAETLRVFNQPKSSIDLIRQQIQLCRLLFSLNKICISEKYPVFFQQLIPLLSKLNFQNIVQEYKAVSIFSPFLFLDNPWVQNMKKHQVSLVAKLLQVYISSIVKAQTSLSLDEQRLNAENWKYFQSIVVRLMCQYYFWLEEESLDKIIFLLMNTKGSGNPLREVKNTIASQAFQLLQNQKFIKIPNYREILLNYIQLFKRILNKQSFLSLEDKIDLVDLTFNLKSDLYSAFSRLEKAKNREVQQYIQTVVDSIDFLEQQFLQNSGINFIRQIGSIIEDDPDPSFSLLISVSIKNIFSLIYPSFFSCQDEYLLPKLQISEDSLNKSINDLTFLQEEIETSSTTLRSIKTKCLTLQRVFERMSFLEDFQTVFQEIRLFTHIPIEKGEDQYLYFQISDLMYLANLVGMNQLKNALISLQLSLAFKYFGLQIFLFELSRLISLEIFSKKEEKHLKSFIRDKIFLKKESVSSKMLQKINFLLDGKIVADIYSSKRIFRLLFLMKTDPLCLVNDYKSIIWSLTMGLFKFQYIPFDISSQKIMLKMSKHINPLSNNKTEQWTFMIWEHDWSFLRLLVIFINKIFKKVIEVNQLSKTKSFLPFALTFLTRSGHLDELSLPIEVMMMKNKELDLLRIADSLRKIVLEEVNHNEYKKIDRILCNKRKSLSMGLNLDGLAKIVNSSFEKAGKIGVVLCDIFMTIIFEMLGANQWQKMKCRYKMPLYQSTLQSPLDNIYELCQGKRSVSVQISNINNLCLKIPKILFKNYQHALILKDYLGELLDQAIQNSQFLLPSENKEIDEVIVKLSILFQEYNYTLKQFWSSHFFHVSLSDITMATVKSIQNLLNDYQMVIDQYQQKIEYKIKKLKDISYPLNIIFPIGSYVYSIACKDTLLITYVKRVIFQDKTKVVQGIIKSNHEILKVKDLNSSINFKKRRGLDNQLGKIIFSSDIGIIDFDIKSISPSLLLNEIVQIHPSLLKFLVQDEQQMSNHLQTFIRRYRLGSISSIKNKIRKAGCKISQNCQYKQINLRQNVLIYLHYKYLSFPVEGTQAVSANKAIYRIPSIEYLMKYQNQERVFSINQCKYLINTKNDLPQTQKRFEGIKKKFNSWTGIVGRIPPVEEIITLLNRHLFLFMGHGTGLEHVPTSEYINFNPKCLMLVFGCSSSQMTFDGSQPSGCSFDFLMRGCPGYLGCLWNVTDVDIDKMTTDMLVEEGLGCFSSILNKCRHNLYYPNLNGMSVVIYGLPSQLIRM